MILCVFFIIICRRWERSGDWRRRRLPHDVRPAGRRWTRLDRCRRRNHLRRGDTRPRHALQSGVKRRRQVDRQPQVAEVTWVTPQRSWPRLWVLLLLRLRCCLPSQKTSCTHTTSQQMTVDSKKGTKHLTFVQNNDLYPHRYNKTEQNMTLASYCWIDFGNCITTKTSVHDWKLSRELRAVFLCVFFFNLRWMSGYCGVCCIGIFPTIII